MLVRTLVVLATAALVTASCDRKPVVAGSAGAGNAPPAGPGTTEPPRNPGSRMPPEQAAVSGPLGSKTNPVRCDFPKGERAYLERLRCPDGSRPAYDRSGSVGLGPYGNVLDLYVVTCSDGTHDIFMDMYHPGHIETEPIPGFTITE